MRTNTINAEVKDEERVTILDLRTKNKVSVYPVNSLLRRTWAPVKNWSFPTLILFI